MTQGAWRGCPGPRSSPQRIAPGPPSFARQAPSEPAAAGAPCASAGPGLRGHGRASRRPSRTLGKVAREEEAGGEEGRREAEAWTRRAAAEPAGEVS